MKVYASNPKLTDRHSQTLDARKLGLNLVSKNLILMLEHLDSFSLKNKGKKANLVKKIQKSTYKIRLYEVKEILNNSNKLTIRLYRYSLC